MHKEKKELTTTMKDLCPGRCNAPNSTRGDCWESQHHFPVTEKVSAQKRRKGIGDPTITINQQGN